MKTPIDMTDNELDSLLSMASAPPQQVKVLDALQIKMAGEHLSPAAGNIVRFPGAAKQAGPFRWLAALPLAASLAAGIWLGAAGQGTNYLFNNTDELTSVADVFDTSTGIDDAENLTEEDLS